MARGKMHPIVLTPEEREVLERTVRGRTVAQRGAPRARLLLLSADGATDAEVARAVGISLATVQRWRSRFTAERLAGLEDRPRPGRPPRYTEADRARVISIVGSQTPPEGATHWTVRSLAKASGMGREAVHQILRGGAPGAASGAPWGQQQRSRVRSQGGGGPGTLPEPPGECPGAECR